MKDPNKLFFNTVFPGTLCRGGGNGPNHPSQLYAIKKYVKPGESILDVGCGNATTAEAIRDAEIDVKYKGVDMIPKNIQWCKQTFPEFEFEVQDAEALSEKDKSWDVVYSRHVVDHMPSFAKALNEHCRVAKRLVIIILWLEFTDKDDRIQKIVEDPQGKNIVYETEYYNQYGREKVIKTLNKEGWKLVELTEHFKPKDDTIIVLERV